MYRKAKANLRINMRKYYPKFFFIPIFILSFILFSSFVSATTDETGSQGANTDSAGYMRINYVVASASGTLTSIGANMATTNGNIRVAIYSDVAGIPTALLAESGSVAQTGTGWNDIALTGVSITASSKYWIGFQNSGGTSYNCGTAGNPPCGNYDQKSQAFGTFPATWVAGGCGSPPACAGSYTPNIRMTYAAAPPPPVLAFIKWITNNVRWIVFMK